MELKLGLTYLVKKADGTEVIFLFRGGNPPCGEVNGIIKTIAEIIEGGFTSYRELTI